MDQAAASGPSAGDQPLGVPPAYDRSHTDGAAAAPPAAVCANCEAPLVGPYCAQCGQRASPRLVSVHAIVADALEDQLSLNAALPRTLAALFLHPGKLSADYVRGRIVRYIPPMRLYLGASLLFFLTLSFIAAPRALQVGNARDAKERAPAAPAAPATPGKSNAGASPASARAPAVPGKVAATSPATGATVDTVLATEHGKLTVEMSTAPEWLRRRLKAQEARLNAMGQKEGIRTLVAAMINTAPKVVFVLLPFFALILKVLYIRRGRLYAEHFVFALHTHAFAFAVFTVMLLARNGIVSAILCSWLAVYCLLAMRRVYGQGWTRTVLKYGALGFIYMFVLVMGAGIGVVVALLSI